MALGALLGAGLPIALQGASALTGLLGRKNDRIKRSPDEERALETIRGISRGDVPAAAQGALAGAQRRNLGAARAAPGSNPNLGVRNALRANQEAIGEVATRAGQQQLSAARTLLGAGQQRTAQETQLEQSKDVLPAVSSMLNTGGAALQSYGFREALEGLLDDDGSGEQVEQDPEKSAGQKVDKALAEYDSIRGTSGAPQHSSQQGTPVPQAAFGSNPQAQTQGLQSQPQTQQVNPGTQALDYVQRNNPNQPNQQQLQLRQPQLGQSQQQSQQPNLGNQQLQLNLEPQEEAILKQKYQIPDDVSVEEWVAARQKARAQRGQY